MGNLTSRKCKKKRQKLWFSPPQADVKPYNNLEIQSPPHRKETVMAYVQSVYDGDTCTVIYYINNVSPFKINIRFKGIDTPEVRTSNLLQKEVAKMIRDYVRSLIENKTVDLYIEKWSKYGGIIQGVIYTDIGSISDHLLNKGIAKPYIGKKKEPWTDEELNKIKEILSTD